MSIFFLSNYGQAQHNSIPALKIGDKMPDMVFDTVANYSSNQLRLSDFKGKLIILDFWATWCTSCIYHFHQLDSLQKRFKDQIQIVLVDSKSTKDNYTKVTKFFKSWTSRYKNFALPTTIGDTIAEKYFPHTVIPHVVWLSKDGIIKSITTADEVTGPNIRNLLEMGENKLFVKDDFKNRPLFLTEDITITDVDQYSIFLKGQQPGLGHMNRWITSGNLVRGRALINRPILVMYQFAVNGLNGNLGFDRKRTLIELQNSNESFINLSDEAFACSFELIVPKSETSNLYQYMLQDLNRYSGYYGRIEKRKTKCWALIATGEIPPTKMEKSANKLYDSTNRRLSNMPITALVNFLNDAKSILLPLIDQSKFLGQLDIQLPGDLSNIAEIRKALQLYNLDLVEMEISLDMFVLGEKNGK